MGVSGYTRSCSSYTGEITNLQKGLRRLTLTHSLESRANHQISSSVMLKPHALLFIMASVPYSLVFLNPGDTCILVLYYTIYHIKGCSF